MFRILERVDRRAREAGIGGISHVTLAARLMRSLGVHTLAEFPTSPAATSCSSR